MKRRAVTVGVSTFRSGEDLEFASGMVTELAAALEALGYTCERRPAGELSGEELGELVVSHLEPPDADLVQVVHVLTHGRSESGTVYALGSEGTSQPSADIAHWVASAQRSTSGLTLFLLDLCHAGRIARSDWRDEQADGHRRAWVIAATKGDHSAFDGRFTQAVTNVLRAAAAGEIDVDPTSRYLPMQVIAPAIRRELNQLVVDADGYSQEVTATMIDISAEIDLPFFPNPRYAPHDRDLALRASLDPGVAPFFDDLDEGLDARHFVERAAGTGMFADDEGAVGSMGCFAGREAQLKRLVPWLFRVGPGSVGVVTGSPGVGKSALLGILVCAAHPMLREHTREVWERAALPPIVVDGFAAAHARQRNLAVVVRSLAAQLGLGEPAGAGELIAGIQRLPREPVIVLDALDEAEDGEAIMARLLLPLAEARRADGGPAVRLLVGTRRYEQFAPLLAAARAGLVVDLDEVPRAVLMRDLDRYVADLLWTTRYQSMGGVRGAFATAVATALAAPWDGGPDGHRWGEFLVAGLYTKYFVTARSDLVTDPELAQRLGADVPRTLPEVLELDLAARPGQPWLRPVLAALACAHGEGMPASVLARAATAFATGAEPLAPGDLRDALRAGQFYLRQATDVDHTTLYRLFHEGLADYLRRHPGSARSPLLDRLLGSLGPAGRRDWSAAEPYVLRHAAQHAATVGWVDELLDDPEFLLAADRAALLALVPRDRRIRAIPADDEPMDRRTALARNAALLRLTGLAARAANPPGRPPLTWQPLWGSRFSARLPAPTSVEARCALIGTGADRLVVAAAPNGAVEAVDLVTGLRRDHPGRVPPVPLVGLRPETVAGRPLVLLMAWKGQDRLWDPTSGTLVDVEAETRRPGVRPVRMLVGDKLVVVGPLSGGRLQVVDQSSGKAGRVWSRRHTGEISALAACEVRYPMRDVIHQAFFGWSHHSEGMDILAHSFSSQADQDRWRHRLMPLIRLQSDSHGHRPQEAFSYIPFEDGLVAVIRRADVGYTPGRNNSHVLIGTTSALDASTAVGLAEWAGWREECPADPAMTTVSTEDLGILADSGERAWGWLRGHERELVSVLGRLVDNPRSPLSIIGCPEEGRLAMVWGLRAAADEYLRERYGVAREWSFSTYETRHHVAVEHLPEIVFVPEGREALPAHRVVVDLTREMTDPPSETVLRLVSDLRRSTAVRRVRNRPLVFSGGSDATVRVWDAATGEQLEVVPFDSPVSAIEATPDGYLVVATQRYVVAFRHVDGVRGALR